MNAFMIDIRNLHKMTKTVNNQFVREVNIWHVAGVVCELKMTVSVSRCLLYDIPIH